MGIEYREGVHTKEKLQYGMDGKKKKTTAERYSDFHGLNKHPFVESDDTEDVGRGRVRILDE